MLIINFDISPFLEAVDGIAEVAASSMRKWGGYLTAQTRAHIVEEANKSLHTRRQMFVDGLRHYQVSEDTFVISLDARARWIDDGMEAHSMVDDLLKSKNAKTSADGCVLNPRNKVLTDLGWKRIKDIVPGDRVLTHSGKYREVKALRVSQAGMGTKYIQIRVNSTSSSRGRGESEILCPSLSLTLDHPVLTPSGWVPAGELKKGDLVATPADLKRLCRECGSPLPINIKAGEYCVNNKCKRQASYKEGRGLGSLTREERVVSGRAGGDATRRTGCCDRKDWGARDPEHLKRMRDASVQAMRDRLIDGEWAPEVFFERELSRAGVSFVREHPIATDRVVNAGRGRTRQSILYLDFWLPELGMAIELDGSHWHQTPIAMERDQAKDRACSRDGIKLVRIPSHEIFGRGAGLADSLRLLGKNHSGELGVAWVSIMDVKKGTVNRPDHAYSKKYDIVLDADEHSFCCQTVFIHNSRYASIPFEHGPKGPTQMTEAQSDLLSTIKAEMAKKKIPYAKLEKNALGATKLGLLHKFDITSAPLKTGNGPGQGAGPVGAVRQGPTGIPFLQGVNVYQLPVPNVGGKPKVKKFIMTFRTVSSKHKGQSRWEHPGLKPVHLMDQATGWAQNEWDHKIVPALLEEIISSL